MKKKLTGIIEQRRAVARSVEVSLVPSIEKYKSWMFDREQLTEEARMFREEIDFIRLLKDGPASMLPLSVKQRLMHMGKERAFREAFGIVDQLVTALMRDLLMRESSDRAETSGFLDGGSTAIQEVMRERWLERRKIVISDYTDLIEQWEIGKNEP